MENRGYCHAVGVLHSSLVCTVSCARDVPFIAGATNIGVIIFF